MAIACSVEASKLAPIDKVRYEEAVRRTGVMNTKAHKVVVDMLLAEAEDAHKNLLAQIENNYPGFLNQNNDLLIQPDSTGQLTMFTKAGEPRAALSRRSGVPEEVIVANEAQARAKKLVGKKLVAKPVLARDKMVVPVPVYKQNTPSQVEIIANPTRTDMLGMLRSPAFSKSEKSLRYIVDDNTGALYVWNGDVAVHDDVARALKIKREINYDPSTMLEGIIRKDNGKPVAQANDGASLPDSMLAATAEKSPAFARAFTRETTNAKTALKKGSAKPSPTQVATGEQAGGTKTAAKGKSLKRKSTGEDRETPKKAAEKSSQESKPTGQEEPQQAKRKKQQPPNLDIDPEDLADGPARIALAKEYIEYAGSTGMDNEKEYFSEGARILLNYGVFIRSTGQTRVWETQLATEINDPNGILYGNAKQAAWTREVFLDIAKDELVAKTTVKGKPIAPTFVDRNGTLHKWAALALDRGWLLDAVKQMPTKPNMTGAPKAITDIFETDIGRAAMGYADVSVKDIVREIEKQTNEEATYELQELIGTILRQTENTDNEVKAYNARVNTLIEDGADTSAKVRGARISEWFPNGKGKWVDNKLMPPERDQITEADRPLVEGKTSNIEDGSPITKPVSELVLNSYISKVRRTLNEGLSPRFLVVKNLADFKKRYPAQYKEATTSRKDGTSNLTETAAGYSYGKTVVIFRNNIRNRQHLKFVVAHETLGHFGLGSFMKKANLIKLMDDIYASDPYIRAETDRRMELYGMDKTEAVEEAVADFAGEVETSIIMKLWHHIKNFLNKLGVKFSDDMARFFVGQSRRLLRTGSTGDLSAYGVYSDIADLQRVSVEGRASEYISSSHGLMRSLNDNQGTVEGLWNTLKEIGGNMTSGTGLDANVRKLATTSSNIGTNVGRFLEWFQTLDNKATRSIGLQRIFKIFEGQTEHVRKLQTILNDKTNFSNRYSFNKFAKVTDPDDWRNGPPPQQHERDHANRLLAEGALYLKRQVDESRIKKYGNLLDVTDGVVTRNDAAIKRLFEAGQISRKQFEDGLEEPRRSDEGDIIEGGTPHVYKSPPITGRVWKIYTEQVAARNEAALMVYEDKVRGMLGSKEKEIQSVKTTYGFSDEQADTIRELADIYAKLYEDKAQLQGKAFRWNAESVENARVFLHQALRVLNSKVDPKTGKRIGELKVTDWEKGSTRPGDEKLEPFRQAYPDLAKKLKALSTVKLNEDKINQIRNTLMDMHLLDSQLVNAEYSTINTVLSGYVPFLRRGNFQVRIQAYDANGKAIDLDDSVKDMLYYSRFTSMKEAQEKAEALNKVFADYDPAATTVKLFQGAKDENGKFVHNTMTGVTFKALSGTATTVPTLGGSINYDDMANTLLRAGITLREKDRDRLIAMTSKQHSTARSRMRRSGNPGWDTDIMRGLAEYLEMQTHIAGKNLFKHQIAHTMSDTLNEGLWSGNPELLKQKQDNYIGLLGDPSASDAARKLAFQDMVSYQHAYVESSDAMNIRIVARNGSVSTVDRGKGKRGQYLSDAGKLVEFYNNTINLSEATGEEKFGKIFGVFAQWTAAAQLGGALAPALINSTSLVSHAIPYLATLNKKTGYGGGFGISAASAAIYRAGSDMSLITSLLKRDDQTGSAAKLKVLLEGPEGNPKIWKPDERVMGMTRDEMQFIYELTEKGVLTPNMFNALIGASRTGKHNSGVERFLEKWMFLFSKTEQYNRRVTALASYRLEKARRLEAGATIAQFEDKNTAIAKDVYQRAITAVNASQGNYSQYNRPNWARGNVAQYLYMYKQFVVITIQLMKNLSTSERMWMLAFLVAFSGLKGLPFAEDTEDLIDTLMQKFNIKWKGLEVYIAQLSDAVLPGSSRILLRGVADLSGATASTRIGQGNLLPGTSYFLAGADTGREIADVAGPIVSAWSGMIEAAGLTARYAAEKVGLRDDTTNLRDILRTGGGFTALKAAAESMIYMADGSVTNKKGQIVAKDFGATDMIWRMMGFYPASATTQYDINRMTQRVRDYSDVIKEGYIQAYREASSSSERSRIRRLVREWNRDAGRDSPFYIRNFTQSATRARKEAELTASARLLKSAPKSIRELQKSMMQIHGYDTKGIAFNS